MINCCWYFLQTTDDDNDEESASHQFHSKQKNKKKNNSSTAIQIQSQARPQQYINNYKRKQKIDNNKINIPYLRTFERYVRQRVVLVLNVPSSNQAASHWGEVGRLTSCLPSCLPGIQVSTCMDKLNSAKHFSKSNRSKSIIHTLQPFALSLSQTHTRTHIHSRRQPARQAVIQPASEVTS